MSETKTEAPPLLAPDRRPNPNHEPSDSGCDGCGTCVGCDSCADKDNPIDLARGDCEQCGACGDCIKACAAIRDSESVPEGER